MTIRTLCIKFMSVFAAATKYGMVSQKLMRLLELFYEKHLEWELPWDDTSEDEKEAEIWTTNGKSMMMSLKTKAAWRMGKFFSFYMDTVFGLLEKIMIKEIVNAGEYGPEGNRDRVPEYADDMMRKVGEKIRTQGWILSEYQHIRDDG